MKVGLYFGSFNPIHHGHLMIAGYMLENAGIDQLWFVVSPQNPHKNKSTLLDERQRLRIAELAIGDNPRMRASDIEFRLPRPSYTVHTLAFLTEKYPGHSFSLIMGSDNLESFPRWKNADVLLTQCELLVYPRPGFDAGSFTPNDRIRIVQAPLIEVSSTMIREGIRNKKDMRYFVPPDAWNYIREMHFYEK